jgi:hypothetical protein
MQPISDQAAVDILNIGSMNDAAAPEGAASI